MAHGANSKTRTAATVALLLVLAAGLSAAGLATGSLSLHDEGRVAGIGREMLDRGSLAVPLLDVTTGKLPGTNVVEEEEADE